MPLFLRLATARIIGSFLHDNNTDAAHIGPVLIMSTLTERETATSRMP